MITPFIITVSVISALLTIYDKIASKKLRKHRVPEKVLLTVALFGGALSEYITMKIIRHKTRHKKFMTGLPVIIFVHVIIFLLHYFVF
jgi:uncharacterized membrane protein YsdA (DUF1294 family)